MLFETLRQIMILCQNAARLIERYQKRFGLHPSPTDQTLKQAIRMYAGFASMAREGAVRDIRRRSLSRRPDLAIAVGDLWQIQASCFLGLALHAILQECQLVFDQRLCSLAKIAETAVCCRSKHECLLSIVAAANQSRLFPGRSFEVPLEEQVRQGGRLVLWCAAMTEAECAAKFGLPKPEVQALIAINAETPHYNQAVTDTLSGLINLTMGLRSETMASVTGKRPLGQPGLALLFSRVMQTRRGGTEIISAADGLIPIAGIYAQELRRSLQWEEIAKVLDQIAMRADTNSSNEPTGGSHRI